MNLLSLYKKISFGGDVRRFHTSRMIFEQNVAQHSFNCALLVYALAGELKAAGEDIDANRCMLHMLIHDLAEQEVGDVPGHIKESYDCIKVRMDELESKWVATNLQKCFEEGADTNLNPLEELVCKFVDMYDAYRTASREIVAGNSPERYQPVLDGISDRLNKLITGMGQVAKKRSALCQLDDLYLFRDA